MEYYKNMGSYVKHDMTLPINPPLSMHPNESYRPGRGPKDVVPLSRAVFQQDVPNDGSEVTVTRTLIGRLTKRRYHRLRRLLFRMNERAPYGVSGSGHRYMCGHEHDCCGCVTGIYAGMTITHYIGGFRITIGQTTGRNY